jgi:hypothetical protein
MRFKYKNSQMGRKITIWILIVVAVGLLAYDIYAAAQGYEYTITYVIRTFSKEHPAIPAMSGLMFGYWIGKAVGKTT